MKNQTLTICLKQVQIYHRSGTGRTLLNRCRQMLCVHSPGSSTFLHEMTSWQPSWKCDCKLKISLCQSMHIYWTTTLPYFIPIRFQMMQP